MNVKNLFKKKETREQIDIVSDMIAVIQKEDHLEEQLGDSGRDIKYVFNPVITVNSPDAFTLNPAAIPIIQDSANFYVNRVLIPTDIKRSELRKIMREMRENYQRSRFGFNNRAVMVTFRAPGMDKYCRLSETHPNMYEIRYCAKGYPHES